MIRLKYNSNVPVFIPILKTRQNGINLPIRNVITGELDTEQTITVTEDEANDLLRCFPISFEIINDEVTEKEVINHGETGV
jgi:hypothetical protein